MGLWPLWGRPSKHKRKGSLLASVVMDGHMQADGQTLLHQQGGHGDRGGSPGPRQQLHPRLWFFLGCSYVAIGECHT